MAEPVPAGRAGRGATVTIFVLLMLLTLALVVLSFPAGAYAVYVGPLGNFTSSALFRPYLWVGPVIVPAAFELMVGEAFFILSLVYAGMLLYAALQKKSLPSAVRASVTGGLGEMFSSPLVVVLVSIGFIISGGSLIDDAVSSAGAPIGTIVGDPLALLLGFTASPLVEELGFRVVLIGLIAFLLSSRRPIREALRALWRPSAAYEGLAVGSGAAILIWVATGFSATTFAACHVLCGTTWDWGKFPEALFGGVVLGYLYVRYGFHVAVLTHWGIDYVGSVYSFFGQAAYGIPWNSDNTEFILQYVVDFDTVLIFGLACVLLVTYLGVKKITSRGVGNPPVPTPPVGSS